MSDDDDLVALELAPRVRQQLSLPAIPFPVRRAHVNEIIRPGGVHVDLLLEELHHVASEHPETAPTLGPIIARLALVLGIKAGSEGLPSYAAALLELGLLHAPQEAGLRANHAFGLHMGGQLEEALAEYRALIDAQPPVASPLLRVLAARACGQLGDYAQGYRLLTEGTEALAGDEGFTRLVETYRRRAESAARPPEERADLRRPKFCRACGAALRDAVHFCAECGGRVELR